MLMNWYVLYTKPKWEKKVAEQLEKLGIECYCPIIEKIQQWSDRKKKVKLPLFNSYVFVRVEESQRNSVFQSSGVVRYLFWLGKPAIVRPEEIEVIKRFLSKPSVNVVVSTYKVGDKVTIDSGPFLNQEAIIQKVTNTYCLLVLESLGCVLKMEIQ